MQCAEFIESCWKIPKGNCSFRRKLFWRNFFHRYPFKFLFFRQGVMWAYPRSKGLGISQKGKLQVFRFFQKIESVCTLAMLALLWKSKYSFWRKCQSVLTLALLAPIRILIKSPKIFPFFLCIAGDNFNENHHILNFIWNWKKACHYNFQRNRFLKITISPFIIFKWISKSVCLLCMLCKRLYIAELFTRLLFRCCVSVCKITNAESPNTHLTQQTQHFSISSEIFSVGRINRNHIFLSAASIIKTSTSFLIDSVNF